MEELLKEILEADKQASLLRGRFGAGEKKKIARELRKKMARDMESEHMFILGWHVQKQHHERGETVAVYSQEAYERYQKYLTGERELDWIG